eukprot:scaffold16914_cov53-Phaeocystis_antarctica.AAC.3
MVTWACTRPAARASACAACSPPSSGRPSSARGRTHCRAGGGGGCSCSCCCWGCTPAPAQSLTPPIARGGRRLAARRRRHAGARRRTPCRPEPASPRGL